MNNFNQLKLLKERLYTQSTISSLKDIVFNIETRLGNSGLALIETSTSLSGSEKKAYKAFQNIFTVILTICKDNSFSDKVKIFAKQDPFDAGRVFGYKDSMAKVDFKLTSNNPNKSVEFRLNLQTWDFEYISR